MRKRCQRRIGYCYRETYFKPRGIPLRDLDEIEISEEELETIRLRFLEKLDQNLASEKMNLSQSQYQRDLTNTLEKITKALVEGFAIKIKK